MTRPVKAPPKAHPWTVVVRRNGAHIEGDLWTLTQRLPAGTLLRPVGIR